MLRQQLAEPASLCLPSNTLTALHVTRNASAITIVLSTSPLDTKHPGYQAPLPADQIQPIGDAEVSCGGVAQVCGGHPLRQLLMMLSPPYSAR